jgi:hypothetical protein
MARKVEVHVFSFPNNHPTPGFSLLRTGALGGREVITFAHYCKLLQKILMFPRYENGYLRDWLLFLIKDLRVNGHLATITEPQFVSLRNSLEGYYFQHTHHPSSIVNMVAGWHE